MGVWIGADIKRNGGGGGVEGIGAGMKRNGGWIGADIKRDGCLYNKEWGVGLVLV